MFPFYPLVRVFIINWCLILPNAFSASIDMIIWFSIFSFVNVVYHIDWFVYVEPYLKPWKESNLINMIKMMVYDPFHVLLDCFMYSWIVGFSLLIFCWEFLHLCSSVILAYNFPFFNGVFIFHPWFWYQGWWHHRISLGVFLPLQFFWKSFRRIGVNSLNVWWNSPVKTSGPGLLFFGSF